MKRALLAGSITLGAALLPVCLVVSGVPLFPAPSVPHPQVAAAAPAAGVGAPSGTDTIILSLAAGARDPLVTATAAVQQAMAGTAGSVAAARLIGPHVVAVTLDTTLSDADAAKVTRAAGKQTGVTAADRSLTFEPAGTTIPSYEWNLTGIYGVDASTAWNTTEGKGVVVGVVDTGIASNSALPATVLTKITHVNGQQVTGTTAAGLTVTVKNAVNQQLCTTTADSSGTFNCTGLAPRPADGAVLTVTATDAVGRTSIAKPVVADASTPVPTIAPSNGHVLAGTAEAGATIALTYQRGANQLLTVPDTATADAGGAWLRTPSVALKDGDIVTAIATDPSGNVSEPATRTIDLVPPAAPVLKPTKGNTVSGSKEKGSFVTISWTGADGEHTLTQAADDSATWTATLEPTAENDSTISATATDAAGNTSAAGTIKADSAAPAAPVLAPTKGASVTGSKEKGSFITLTWTGADGEHTRVLDADDAQTWSATLDPVALDGSTISATATDPAGNTSAPGTIVADATAPAAPVLAPTQGSTVTGTKEAGSFIIVTWTGSDGPHSQTLDPTPDTTWTAHLDPTALDDTEISATATDAAGNTSAPGTIKADSSKPDKPVLNPTNGEKVSGTKEKDSFVTVSWIASDGPHELTLPATADTTWSTPLSPAANNDSEISATATDAAGNTSEPGTKIVDHTPPPDPTVDPSNGRTVTVHGVEDEATPTLVDADGGIVAGTWSDAGDGTWVWVYDPTTGPLSAEDTVSVVLTDAAGNTTTAAVTIDTRAPDAPVLDPTQGAAVSGTKEKDSFVTVTWTSAEREEHIVLGATSDTTWSTPLDPPALDNTVIKATATDAAGNTSPAGTVTADSSRPDAPVLNPTQGASVSGTKEKGSFVTITWDGSTDPLVLEASDATTWSTGLDPSATDGSLITATVTDAAGNVSDAGQVKVDADRPDAPSVDPTNGRTLRGSAEADSTVTITYHSAAGDRTVTATASGSGSWSRTLRPRAVDGSTISVTATDAAGNVSPDATVVVDATAPNPPKVAPSDGSTVQISDVEDGATPSLRDENDDPWDGSWIDSGSGSWVFTPQDALTEADQASVVLTDKAGNRSTPVLVEVDTIAPEAPVVTTVATTDVSGTAEAGTDVTVHYLADSAVWYDISVAAGSNGSWSAALDPTAAAGSELTVTATDAVGHHSPPTTAAVPAADSAPAGPDASDTSDSPSASPSDTTSGGVEVASSSQGATVAISTATVSTAAADTTIDNGTNQLGAVLPGYDFVDSDPDPSDASATSHGTHVAGIVAASGAGSWLPAGVAPMAQIEPLRALDSGSTQNNMQYVINAINWGAGIPVGNLPANPEPVDVLNLSIAATSASCPTALQDAINNAVAQGVVVVAAAGNNNASIASTSPANCANVIVATASTATGERASYSNWGTSDTGSAWLVAAPGGSGDGISSCTSLSAGCPGGIFSTVADSYQAKSGTSMSAPHVAGVAALLKAIKPGLSPAAIARIIRGTATTMSDACPSALCGTGIVDAARAVAAASADTSVTVADAASASVSVSLSHTGAAQVGTPLTATGTTNYSSLTYQWLRNGVPIAGATTPYYQLTGADYGTSVQIRVATAVGGTSVTSAAVRVVVKGVISQLSPRPAITATSGKAASYKVKKTIRATIGTWSVTPTTVSYQWYRGSKAIKKATRVTYKLVKADRGKKVRVKVTVSAVGYQASFAYSASHKVKR